MVWWCVALQRVVGLAVKAIEMVEQGAAEAPPHPFAGQRTQRRQCAHAHVLQAFAGIARQRGATHRHLVEQGLQRG